MPRKQAAKEPAETAPEETPTADTTAAEAAETTTDVPEADRTAAELPPDETTEEPAPEDAEETSAAGPSGPEPWNSPEILALQLNWNEKSEVRDIGMPLTKEELSEAANLLADTVTKIRELEASKKASADHFKGLIVDQEEIQNAQSQLIRRGTAPKPVPCRWLYQVSGRGDDGRFVRDDNSKTLIRLDSGEVLGVKLVTSEERQMSLPLEELPSTGPAAESSPEQEELFTDTGEPDADSTERPDALESSPAFNGGFEAWRSGADIADNPYPDGSDESFAWDRGWIKADKEEPVVTA